MKPSRREAVVGLAVMACGPASSTNVDAGAPVVDAGACGVRDGAPASWLEVALGDFPALQTEGGVAVLERPDALLNVWLTARANGCFDATWRICTHGACNVEASGSEWECPCHGSRFGADGSVLQGPATRGLRVLPVVREGERLFVRKPV